MPARGFRDLTTAATEALETALSAFAGHGRTARYFAALEKVADGLMREVPTGEPWGKVERALDRAVDRRLILAGERGSRAVAGVAIRHVGDDLYAAMFNASLQIQKDAKTKGAGKPAIAAAGRATEDLDSVLQRAGFDIDDAIEAGDMKALRRANAAYDAVLDRFGDAARHSDAVLDHLDALAHRGQPRDSDSRSSRLLVLRLSRVGSADVLGQRTPQALR